MNSDAALDGGTAFFVLLRLPLPPPPPFLFDGVARVARARVLDFAGGTGVSGATSDDPWSTSIGWPPSPSPPSPPSSWSSISWPQMESCVGEATTGKWHRAGWGREDETAAGAAAAEVGIDFDSVSNFNRFLARCLTAVDAPGAEVVDAADAAAAASSNSFSGLATSIAVSKVESERLWRIVDRGSVVVVVDGATPEARPEEERAAEEEDVAPAGDGTKVVAWRMNG